MQRLLSDYMKRALFKFFRNSIAMDRGIVLKRNVASLQLIL